MGRNRDGAPPPQHTHRSGRPPRVATCKPVRHAVVRVQQRRWAGSRTAVGAVPYWCGRGRRCCAPAAGEGGGCGRAPLRSGGGPAVRDWRCARAGGAGGCPRASVCRPSVQPRPTARPPSRPRRCPRDAAVAPTRRPATGPGPAAKKDGDEQSHQSSRGRGYQRQGPPGRTAAAAPRGSRVSRRH